MSKESFFYSENYQHLKLLDEAAHRGGVSRGKAFEDFLQMATSALARPRMEQEYLDAVKPYTSGKPGQRGCDSIAQLFASLIASMEETRDEMKDVLGDLFQGGITYGEKGQFLTPQPVARLLANLQVGGSDQVTDTDEEVIGNRTTKRVFDPACGSGRMLLAVAELQPHWEYFGQDIDRRCVQMTVINLALRNLYGYVFLGDSLRNEIKLVYRTGFNGISVIRYASPGELKSLFESDNNPTPESPPQTQTNTDEHPAESIPQNEGVPPDTGNPSRQLRLF